MWHIILLSQHIFNNMVIDIESSLTQVIIFDIIITIEWVFIY